ncbi:hypothetical protein C8J57DRAFT_1254637 [Mycena rebaudengoi]|nr:hypothetical protein C8J57DRAFT_1254637 [Mycena rebaudengoi]
MPPHIPQHISLRLAPRPQAVLLQHALPHTAYRVEGGNPVDPSAFRIGDIVELGFSVVASKGSQESRAVMKLVMRFLIFLDGSHTRDARVSQRMELVKAERLRYKESRSSKKRTVDRDDISEEEEARQRGPIVFGNTNDGANISIQIG